MPKKSYIRPWQYITESESRITYLVVSEILLIEAS